MTTADVAGAYYRKGSHVFWVLVQQDIVLRNYQTNVAVQLDSDQRRVWELLDGAHSVEQITHCLAADERVKLRANDIIDLIGTLEVGGFLLRT